MLSWLLAHVQKTPLMLDGIGTKFFGRSRSVGTQRYVSTKWLVFLFIPIIPVRSYEINEDSSDEREPLEKLNWAQVTETIWKWKFGYIFLAVLVSGFGIWSFWECM